MVRTGLVSLIRRFEARAPVSTEPRASALSGEVDEERRRNFQLLGRETP